MTHKPESSYNVITASFSLFLVDNFLFITMFSVPCYATFRCNGYAEDYNLQYAHIH